MMLLKEQLAAAKVEWRILTLYEKFEHTIILVLTALIAIIIVLAVWSLAIVILTGIASSRLDLTNYATFQALFGMIFTVIIALEFKRSLLVIAERRESVVQVRTVVLLALLAIVRKLIIIDLSTTEVSQLFALAASIVALGAVHWMVREQDRRDMGHDDSNLEAEKP
jgi:uncharacterized membrane protein (DUF373 family)